MKTILATLLPDDNLEAFLDIIAGLAGQHAAHVVGFMPIPGPVVLPTATPIAVVPYDDTMKRRYLEARPRVRESFETRMDAESVSFEFRSEEQGGLRLTGGIVAQGRTCDLIIVSMHPDVDGMTADAVEEIADLVMAAGRPVLALPPKLKRAFATERIMVAWDASRESARATFDALSLLSKASRVDVVCINSDKTTLEGADLAGAELGAVLARHGVTAEAKAVATKEKDGPAIVDQAIVNGSDILVVGAYGHSRLRERILGGVTEHVLRHPPCAVFLAN